jgi:hypothetical protein
MAPYSIRKLMTIIAAAAFCFAIVTVVGRGCAAARAGGRLIQCERNMRDVAVALQGYYTTQGSFPIGTIPISNLQPYERVGFYALVSPYLDTHVLELIDTTECWNSATNIPWACTRLGVLNCPELPRAAPTALQPTHYIGIAGLGSDSPSLPLSDARAGVFGYDRETTVADFKDGTSTTMMIAESGRVIGSWLQGGPSTVRGLDPSNKPYVGPGRQFGGLHDAGAVVAMADGSVRTISESVAPKVFEAMSTIAGAEKMTVP